MRTPHLVLLLTGSVLTFFSRRTSGHDESSWQPVLYDYYHIDLAELGGHHDLGAPEPDAGGFDSKPLVPRDAIVDAINDLGIKLLAIHNEHNENNIAISPYGAFSVLAALSEGLEGEAALEVLHAAHIPKDKSIIRVGLRDIHRHLKSYFIPEEGFLAGLTLNLNNVTLRSEYEDVLRFYGFDYASFNNALYPEPPTTKRPTEGTTLETGLGVSEETTAATTEQTKETTVAVATEKSEKDATTVEPTTTANPMSTTTTQQQVTTTVEAKEEPTTSSPETTTALETSSAVPEIEPTTTATEEPNPSTPTTEPSTGTVSTSSETTIVQILETESSTDRNSEFYRSSFKETISTSFVSASASETTESTIKDADVTATATESVNKSTAETTTATVTTMLTGNTVRTTRDVTVSQSKDSDKQLTTSDMELSFTSTEFPGSTDNVVASTLAPAEEVAADSFSNMVDTQNGIATTPVSTEFPDQNIDTTTQFFLETAQTEPLQDMAQNQNYDLNYNYETAQAYDDNTVMPNSAGVEFNGNLKRSSRSVVDYVIARIYDDRPHYAPPPLRPLYEPNEPLTFAIYGKYREGGVNFMKYDTVLPYYFAHNLNALALSFPLDSTKYYLLLLLPLRDDGIDQLICDLRIHGNLRYIIDNLRLTHVVATIPSFMLKGYVTLTPSLQMLGVRSIFEPRQADFSPMTNVSDIYVTNIEQAVTVTIRNYLDPSAQRYKNFRRYNPVHFKADHPFLYFVVDSDLHVALMVGKVINPLNSRIS